MAGKKTSEKRKKKIMKNETLRLYFGIVNKNEWKENVFANSVASFSLIFIFIILLPYSDVIFWLFPRIYENSEKQRVPVKKEKLLPFQKPDKYQKVYDFIGLSKGGKNSTMVSCEFVREKRSHNLQFNRFFFNVL